MIHSHEPWLDAEQLGLNTNRRVNFPAGADVKKSQDAQKVRPARPQRAVTS
jgi:hypothetical protein